MFLLIRLSTLNILSRMTLLCIIFVWLLCLLLIRLNGMIITLTIRSMGLLGVLFGLLYMMLLACLDILILVVIMKPLRTTCSGHYECGVSSETPDYSDEADASE